MLLDKRNIGGLSGGGQSTMSIPTASSDSDMDVALTYMKEAGQPSEQIDEKKLLRKIDWRIIPILFACCTIQFIDKYAAVMGLPKDLNLKGNQFTWAATSFPLALLIAEVPTGYLVQKLPAGKYLGANVILWGISTGCTAAATNFTTLVVARVFLGIFEAATAPCLTIITGMWYTTSEQPPRFGLWYCGLGIGQIVGGVISWGFQRVKGEALEGWRMMYTILGIFTVVVGVVTFLFLPDTPMAAAFLSRDEKVIAIRRVEDNQTGIENRRFKWSHVKELVLDVQIYLLILVTMLTAVSSGVISTYSATVIRNFGYKPARAALLNTPSGLVSITVTIISCMAVGRGSNRCLWIVGLAVPGAIGGGLIAFLPKSNQGGLLTGIYLVNSIVPVIMIVLNLLSSNVAGHTKRTVSVSLAAGAFSIGNIIGPQTFQAKDAPDYHPAKIGILTTQGCAALTAVALRVYYVRENARRERLSRAISVERPPNMQWMNLTDKENETFRYAY